MASTSIQTVPSSFTSAFSKPQPEYDVFLNFRGEDTRYKFTDHLYHALVDRKIITFRDDKELEMGKPISLELLEAIEKSRIAVIIFSETYASSKWCLEELTKIDECRDRGILRVLPIFYHVDPSDVRSQKNTFAKDFVEHEKRFEENPTKVLKWKTALTNVASLSGRHLKDGVHEANFIQSIVQWIYSKLKEKHSDDIEDGLVGISSRVEEMISYLDLESTDVHFIGICEKSGMGKTTLARAVFDKILNQFEACSFLENVREESKAHGLKTLQERFLCDIGKGGLRVKDEHKGMQVISDILHNKKVLIVVDDVSERSQLEKLVGKRDLFGKGSRIIVTTEDKDLLASYDIKIVYKARGLNEVEALQLFSLNAFHKPHGENDFLEYCNNFVEYAQRIPLVLKVLGSYLCTRTKNEWESAQNQLRAIPQEKTTKKLRIAFDGLGAEEKNLFLDIACFFKGEEKNRVADILESVYFPNINLKNLIDKSLITLVGGEKLWMHNLLQQMGWEIVSEESEEASERSRLWHCDDVLDVLKNNTGTKHIEGMLLLPPDEEEELNAESFSKMNKLRLLKICKVRLSCLSYLSNELCLLEWHDCPLESLPNSFQPGELVELIMHRSCLQQFPSKFRKLGKLKLIDLSDSQNLSRTPDFTGFSNIERLNFQGCTRLHELHPSVGGLKRLILLNLKDCKCLKYLPYELNLESLKTLILSGCSRFKKFPRIGRNMRSLLELYLDGTAIEELPPTIRRLTGLTLLNLQDCKNLKSFPSDIHSLTSLEILTLSGCKCQPPKAGHLLGLSPIGSSNGATLTFLRLISFLFLSFLALRCTYFIIPIFAITAWSTYCFHNARHPEPEPINLLLSNSFSKLSTLVTLSLSDCNLLALPDDPSCLLSIEYLNLSKNNFICLPDYISQLSKLKILFLDHCSKLKSLPYVPLSTRLVSVQGCTALENYSNQVVVWTLGVAGFTIITCLGLAEDEDGTIAEVSLLDIHLLWQRYVKDQIHQMEGFCHVLPQIEIPEWFERPRSGSFRPISLPSNLFSNKNWKGIALCVIFVVPAHSNDVSPGEDTKYFHEFYCRLDINGDLIAFKVPKETYVDSFGLWLYISHARFRKHLDERNCITPWIGTNSPDIEIKMCGARILYKKDMGEFLQNLGQKIFGSPNDLRGELKSQFSRLSQVDRTQNHLSDFIFPQNASPPRSFGFRNGPAIKTLLPADLHDYSRRRPTPVTKLLPSNETIQGECASRETIFSNQVIAAGTSKSSRQGSIYLGKISSSLQCLQDHYEGPGTHNQCLPQSEIPGWFKSENIARSSSVTIQLPLNLYENLEWMGFAFCAVFSFQKHPTSVLMKGSEFSFIIVCHLKTNLGCMNPLYSISEEDVIISLHQRGFLWLSFIPCWFLSPEWSRCTSVEFSFVSDSSAVSALKCGVDLVYRQKLEFTRRMVQCITSYDGPFTSQERFPFCHPDQFSGCDGSSGTSGHYSYDQFYKTAALDRYNNRSIFYQCILQSEISDWFSHDLLPSDLSPKSDFHPSTLYNFCFPPSKIQDWFSRPNHGHSVTIDLPSNLYHDSNWMGLVLYASFSIHGDPNIIFSNLASGKSHFLYCQCQTSMANIDNQKIAFSTNKEEITWLLNLGEFIWICYVPGEPFKNMLPHCSHIEASFVSDWSGVIVQNCALQLLYQHDQVQFEQELKHCNNLISEIRKLVCKQQEDKKKKNEQYHVDEGLQRKIFSNIDFEVKIFPRLIDQPETDETEIQLGQSDLRENQEKADKCRVASTELTKISGEHLEKGPYDLLQKMDRDIIREESEEPGRRSRFWLHDDVIKVLKSNTSNKLLCRYKFGEDFNPSTLYNCCFPPSKIQDWFSHQNHGCSVTLDLPSNLYHNSNWMGLVLYASFSIQGNSNFIISNLNSGKSHSLYCQCQMGMANVDAQTITFSTGKEEITWLLELGEFIWISYVPGEPFKNMLQLCSRIEASFMSDCSGVIVQNCALKLLYQHDQVQFEQELKHCNNFITENRKLIRKQQEDQKKRNEQYHVDEGLLRKMFSNIGFEAKIPPRLIDQPETDETEIQLGQSDLLENQEKVDKRSVASKEPTKISGEHLEKGPYDLLQKMDQEIIREESEEPGRCITANKLLCKFGEESKYTGHMEGWNLHKQKVVLKVGTMIDRKTTHKANSNSQLANSLARKPRQPIEMDARPKRNSRPKRDRRNALKNVSSDALLSIGGHQSRSLDLPPFFNNQKSFRIKGTNGEFDCICRPLGLSGIDDFSIPNADWEAQRSNSDLATFLRNNLATLTPTPTPSRLKLAQSVKLDEVRVGSVNAEPSQGIKGALPPVLAPPPVAGRLVAVDHTSTWELLKSFAPLEDEVVAPNTTRLGGYDETISSSSSSASVSARSSSPNSASSEEEDKKQNEGPLESTSNRNENETENENKNGIGIVRATNVISVYSFSPRGKLRRSISSWQKGELLGSGSFGTVYEGFTEDGFFFAVREVSLLDQGSQGKQNISYLEQEISLLKQFEHENIVQYLGTEKDESKIYIFLELVTKGSLASLYQKYHLRDSQVSAYTRQILNGLNYLHDKKVIHRDIKCSNILVDASGSVKLADFGLAKLTKLIDIKSCKGAPFWMAPEVVNTNNRFYGLAADIWSLGCTVLEMLTRQHPYSHLEGMQALFMIGKGKPPLVPDSLSRDARDFILKCLQVNPNDRPTAAQLLDHPFVTRPQNSFGPASPHNSIQL